MDGLDEIIKRTQQVQHLQQPAGVRQNSVEAKGK